MAGNVYEFARDGYIVSGSWENHTPTNGGTAATNEVWRRYYAFGGRCGHR